MEKTRLDDLVLQKGFAKDRKEALALIMSGRVLVDEQRVDKAGALLDPSVSIRLKGGTPSLFVSRGGMKLEAALRDFQLLVEGFVCMDLGASTGGFTDCLLQHGARRVHAFDVGRAQLDWKLRQDPRVVVHDNFNVRYLSPEQVGELIDLTTLDLSFISLRKVLPALKPFSPGLVIPLVKPQFEAEREEVSAGGLIESPRLQREILERVKAFIVDEGFEILAETTSPIPGQKGNREFLLMLKM